jgi:hypothetical protein
LRLTFSMVKTAMHEVPDMREPLGALRCIP